MRSVHCEHRAAWTPAPAPRTTSAVVYCVLPAPALCPPSSCTLQRLQPTASQQGLSVGARRFYSFDVRPRALALLHVLVHVQNSLHRLGGVQALQQIRTQKPCGANARQWRARAREEGTSAAESVDRNAPASYVPVTSDCFQCDALQPASSVHAWNGRWQSDSCQ